MGAGGRNSPYRHISPHYIFYTNIDAPHKCKTVPVHFEYESKINLEPVAEQLMAKCVSRPAVFRENDNIFEQTATTTELAIYVQDNKMMIFEYYLKADDTLLAVLVEWFIIYQYPIPPEQILFTELPPKRFGQSPVTHENFKKRFQYLLHRYVNFIFSFISAP